jgi:hypothetical protein
MLKRIFAAAAAVLLAACAGDPTGSDGTVRVEPDGASAILVTNTDDQPVYYRVFNPDAFALWAPCTSPADCPRIEPGQTVRIAYADIGLYAPDSTRAELHWWQFARSGDGYVETGTGSARVQLK